MGRIPNAIWLMITSRQCNASPIAIGVRLRKTRRETRARETCRVPRRICRAFVKHRSTGTMNGVCEAVGRNGDDNEGSWTRYDQAVRTSGDARPPPAPFAVARKVCTCYKTGSFVHRLRSLSLRPLPPPVVRSARERKELPRAPIERAK